MREISLSEYQTEVGVDLSSVQRDQLRTVAPSVFVTPTSGSEGRYDLTPGAFIGAIYLDDIRILVRPKLPIGRLLFLVSYTVGRGKWEESQAALAEAEDLFEAIIPGFAYQLRNALARGVLQDYRTTDEAATTVRGRWRISDQIRHRYGIAPPIEITYDDYTEDTEHNRVLRAAIHRVLRHPARDDRARWGLRAIDSKLGSVRLVGYDPRRLPVLTYDRRTERYRPAVELALLILRSSSFELTHGPVGASAFLIDMNKVFEDFVVISLREALGVSDKVLVQGAKGTRLHLDTASRVSLLPDISVWSGSECRFVGDVKYKRLSTSEYPNADLYQLMAYSVATKLPSGTLVYAAGEEEPEVHQVAHLGKRLETLALRLDCAPADVLGQIERLADRISMQISAVANGPLAA